MWAIAWFMSRVLSKRLGREEAIRVVQACQLAGVQVKMITGDHIGTATAIANRLHPPD
ncbi:MAG: hypothetical protein Fur0046_11030 [Cyanobacteria bacterium J069]